MPTARPRPYGHHSRRERVRAVVLVVALFGASEPAAASGGGGIRDLSSTTIRSCPIAHGLKEHYYIYGAANAYAETIEIACLRDPTIADWLFIAAAACDDTRRCKIGQLAFPAEHDAHGSDPDASPRVMRYEVTQYTIGKKCRLLSYREDDFGHDADTRFFWSCEVYTSRSDPLSLEAVGATKMLDDKEEGAANLPLQTTQPAYEYTAEAK